MLLWIKGPGVWGQRWRRSPPSSKWASSSVPPRSAAGTPKCARSWTCTKILVFETIRDSKESPPTYLLGQRHQFFKLANSERSLIATWTTYSLITIFCSFSIKMSMNWWFSSSTAFRTVPGVSYVYQKKITCFSSDPSNIYGFKELSISILLLVQKIFGMIRNMYQPCGRRGWPAPWPPGKIQNCEILKR